ncbi:hypothetical protein Q8F55_001612 [Vanrija albida]|uniref:Xylanolytic transcriptional activator regulatory domain-containing protein n=1 Tax=Vanrija albida TaxID=181172 RepID=A0ABR3QGH6_9TREE
METGFSFADAIGLQLGVTGCDSKAAEGDAPLPSRITAYPPKELAEQFVNLFFDYTIAFYPIHDRQEIQDDIDALYSGDEPPSPETIPAPDYRVYRLFLMLAGGCTLFESRHGRGYTDTSESLCKYAMEHFPAVFRGDDFQCLTGLTTFVNYSVVHFGRVSQYIAAGVASRFALEIGLHNDGGGADTSPEQQQRRRRLFWSVYNLDRLVAAALNQRYVIPDDVITTPLPTDIHITAPLLGYLSPVDYFAIVVRGRQVAGFVAEAVYLAPQGDARETQQRIHALADDWYASIPRDEAGGVLPFFELCYHALQVNIYRPSPLAPATEASRMPILRRHAYTGFGLQTTLTAKGSDAANTLQFLSMINLAATLIYTILEADGDPRNLDSAVWRQDALAQTAEVEELVARYCEHTPGGIRFRAAFSGCANQVRAKMAAAESAEGTAGAAHPPPHGSSSLVDASSGCSDPLCCAMSKANGTGPCEGCGRAQTRAFTAPTFDAPLHSYFQHPPVVNPPQDQSTTLPRELWESWAAPSLLGEQNLELAVAGIGMDELFANVGLDLYAPTVDVSAP